MEMMSLKKHIIPGLFLVISVLPALGQMHQDSLSFTNPVYSVSGKLSLCNASDAVKTASVRLIDAQGQEIQQTYTDENGYYTLTWLAPGTYSLKFEWSGEQTTLSVDVKSDLENQNACLPAPAPSTPSIDSNQAGSDIKNGIVQIYICNPGAPLTQSMLDQVANKYGFHFTFKGKCLSTAMDEKAFDAYNAQVITYLNTKNKPGWESNLNNELQALISKMKPADDGVEFFLR
jgi:hypothetical protein